MKSEVLETSRRCGRDPSSHEPMTPARIERSTSLLHETREVELVTGEDVHDRSARIGAGAAQTTWLRGAAGLRLGGGRLQGPGVGGGAAAGAADAQRRRGDGLPAGASQGSTAGDQTPDRAVRPWRDASTSTSATLSAPAIGMAMRAPATPPNSAPIARLTAMVIMESLTVP